MGLPFIRLKTDILQIKSGRKKQVSYGKIKIEKPEARRQVEKKGLV